MTEDFKTVSGKGKTVLVTGGAGFIGSHVVRDLIAMDFKVVVLDDLSGGFKENVPTECEFVQGSITDKVLVQRLFKEHAFEYVYHLAAYAAEGLSHFIKKFNYENNLIGSINLINASINHHVKCFVFTSSIAVYGTNQLPMKESVTPMPEDSYGIAKYSVEMELKASHEMFGLDYVIFRPHNVFGEYQNLGDKYRNVIGIFMNQIMSNKPITIFGDGKQSRAFSDVKDISPIIAKSANFKAAYGEVFNIGADDVCTVNDLAKAVIKAMGSSNHEIIYLDGRNEVQHAYADHSKVTEVFNYKPSFTLPEGLKRMAEWAKQTGVQTSKDFGEIEILKNLPPSWKPQTT